MQWPTTVARRGAVPLLVRRKMNGCSLFGCSARSNRLCENGCPDFSLLLLLGSNEQIFGVKEQILGQDQSDQGASARRGGSTPTHGCSGHRWDNTQHCRYGHQRLAPWQALVKKLKTERR